MFYKPEIRKAIRAKRRQLTEEFIATAGKAAAASAVMLSELIDAKNIGYYLTNEGELDPSYIANSLRSTNKHQFYLPAPDPADPQKLVFYRYQTGDGIVESEYGILEPEPDPAKRVNADALDVILLPLVSFDEACNRIGRGAGNFDRTLEFCQTCDASTRPKLIGLAYEFQKIPNIVPNEWDIPLDMVITEQAIYRAN